MADYVLNVDKSGPLKYVSRRTKFNRQKLSVTIIRMMSKSGSEYRSEIPNNYTQWHIDNIISDFNAGKRTILVEGIKVF